MQWPAQGGSQEGRQRNVWSLLVFPWVVTHSHFSPTRLWDFPNFILSSLTVSKLLLSLQHHLPKRVWVLLEKERGTGEVIQKLFPNQFLNSKFSFTLGFPLHLGSLHFFFPRSCSNLFAFDSGNHQTIFSLRGQSSRDRANGLCSSIIIAVSEFQAWFLALNIFVWIKPGFGM